MRLFAIVRTMSTVVDRNTKYVSAIRDAVRTRGHATNVELLEDVRAQYPRTSATTVHRVTARLREAGELQLAPSCRANAMRYDANTAPHDHFLCTRCDRLRDVELPLEVRQTIESTIADGCKLSGSLTVSGICKNCDKEE